MNFPIKENPVAVKENPDYSERNNQRISMFDAKQIKDLRTKLGLTQAAFAKKLGTTQGNVSKLERGEIGDPGGEIRERLRDLHREAWGPVIEQVTRLQELGGNLYLDDDMIMAIALSALRSCGVRLTIAQETRGLSAALQMRDEIATGKPLRQLLASFGK